MADSTKQFTAENRIPSRPLSYELRDLAQPKELLVDYERGLIYVVTPQKTFINITDAIKEQISMDADSVRAVEIELEDGTKVTVEAGIVSALVEIDTIKSSLSGLSSTSTDHENRIKSLESGSASDERVEQINQQLEAMSTIVGEHTTVIAGLETSVEEAGSAASAASSAAATAQSTANTAKSTADKNKTDLATEATNRQNADETLQTNIDNVDEKVDELTETVNTNKTAAENKATELANSISGLSDTVTANKNALDTKNSEQDTSIKALQDYNKSGVLILNTTISADAGAWSDTNGEAPYKQTITLDGILESDYPIVDIDLSDDYATAVDELESYSLIMKILTFDGYIEVYATEPTSVALNIYMKTDRKSTN